MIVLSKREKETLHEISKWPEFPEYWKPKTRAKLERLGLVANVSETWCSANYGGTAEFGKNRTLS
ncbi:hypothetical protein FEK40_17885 [Escherichia coli]|nr:hypothetical protein [Escherichia coli]